MSEQDLELEAFSKFIVALEPGLGRQFLLEAGCIAPRNPETMNVLCAGQSLSDRAAILDECDC